MVKTEKMARLEKTVKMEKMVKTEEMAATGGMEDLVGGMEETAEMAVMGGAREPHPQTPKQNTISEQIDERAHKILKS